MFNPMREGCLGGMGGVNQPISYCQAIKTLFSEHVPLTKQMDAILLQAENIAKLEEQDRGRGIGELTSLVLKFKTDLERHSDKEEDGLFPILGRHIGTQMGPIAVMEYEHREAKRYIQEYLNQQLELPDLLLQDTLSELCLSLVRGIQVLMEHFKKEENILFPMAEKALSEEEKQELLAIVEA